MLDGIKLQGLWKEPRVETNNIADILAERGSRYGEFKRHAEITMALKDTIERYGQHLDDEKTEALHMIAHKIGRILNGDPSYVDSWVDIAGYAKLVADRLTKDQAKIVARPLVDVDSHL